MLRKRNVDPMIYFEEKFHQGKYELKKRELKDDYENRKRSMKERSHNLE